MSGKGDDRRPLTVDEKTFSDNWDRIFGAKKDYYASVRSQNYADSLRLEGLDGARLGANSGSNPANDGSIPSAPATHDASWDRAFPDGTFDVYINADTGEQVDEDWWPKIELG